MPSWAFPALFAALACAAAYHDVRFRTIPNLLNAAIGILGLAAAWLLTGGDGALMSLAHLAIALAIGMVAYALKMWGAGDAKFYAASAAWFSLGDFPRLIFAISISGLVVLVVWFGTQKLWQPEVAAGAKRELPYGVAIAAGAILTMALRLIGDGGA